tara:strand:+ start:194 stop:493 length:300 start_codon:yes stop_codon:yes gene_type:complete
MNVPLVFQLNQQHLNNNIPCNMHDVVKLYQVGDLIHYPGRVYAHNNFYARIDHIVPTGMGITVLNKIIDGNNVKFYLTEYSYPSLRKRSFNLIDRINLY